MEALPRFFELTADDHPLFLEGLVRALEDRPDLELVGCASDGHEALEAIRRLRPDVALLDLKMPGLDGTRVVSAVKGDGLPTRVVMISAYADDELIYRALAAGAARYLSKEVDRAAIFDAVAMAAEGRVIISSELQTGLARQIRRRESHSRPLLTEREQEVLSLISEGRRAPEVARLLHLSPATVKTHLQSI